MELETLKSVTILCDRAVATIAAISTVAFRDEIDGDRVKLTGWFKTDKEAKAWASEHACAEPEAEPDSDEYDAYEEDEA